MIPNGNGVPSNQPELRRRDPASVVGMFLLVTDWLVIAFASLVAHRVYLQSWDLPAKYRAVIIVALLLVALLFPHLGAYRTWRGISLFREVRIVVVAWLGVVLSLTAMAFGTKMGADYSRGWMITWTVFGTAGLTLERILLRVILRWVRSRGINLHEVVIAGTARLTAEVTERLRNSPWIGIEVIGVFTDGDDSDESQPAVSHRGRLDELATFVADHRVYQIWLVFPLKEEEAVRSLLHELRHSTADIRFVPDIFAFRLLNHSVTEVAGLPVLNLTATPMVGLNRLAKAFEDRVLALLILVVISPLMLLIAIGVKLSSRGPVLFKQRRNGWDGRSIEIYKFRSMRVHQEDGGAVTQATANDSRVTRFGAFLRRTSLDELPQFFNVLQGRMSIVGPRPHAIVHNEEYKELIDAYMLRHCVKPGITGWAQVNGLRGETDTIDKMRKRVECDLFYIENWSVWFDIKIILLTVFKGFVNRNAY